MSATANVETMTNGLVEYCADGGIATITMNDPPANTYTHEMMKDLDEAILKARFDDGVHVILLRGAGDKFFSAGANIKMLATVSPQFKYYFCLHANETLNKLEHTPKIVIAAINGHCVGGGLEIAMAADIRLAKKGGGKMGLPEVNLGVLPGTGGTQRLLRLVPNKSVAIDLMVTGRNFDFEEAKALGLVNHLYEAAEFDAKVQEFCKQFVPPGKASKAVGRIKRSVQSGAEMPFEVALTLERELQQQLFQSEDAKEGINGYVNKKTPQFKGA